jgi:hypothetical protein
VNDTVALAELDPVTRQRVYSSAEMRARSILSRMDSIAAKLKTLEADIRILWEDFDNLKAGETILGCATKKEFCEKKLHRTPRAIQYLLAGQSNPEDRPHKPSELSSLPVEPAHKPSGSVSCTCPDCGEPFSSYRLLKEHGREVHNVPSDDIAVFLRRANGETEPEAATPSEETHWISKDNRCPTGKRGFEFPDEIWQLMRAEVSIGPTDFIAYIGQCGYCGRCHRDKDQSGHKENTPSHLVRHQTWYRPDELNEQPQLSTNIEPEPPQSVTPSAEPTVKSRMTLLREWFAAKYPAFKLVSAAYDMRQFGRVGRNGRFDLTMYSLTPSEVKAVGELLNQQTGKTAA